MRKCDKRRSNHKSIERTIMEKIRLNQNKRQLLKKEWQHTVYNNMPMQVEEDLKSAQQEYREVRDMAWDGVITPSHAMSRTSRYSC